MIRKQVGAAVVGVGLALGVAAMSAPSAHAGTALSGRYDSYSYCEKSRAKAERHESVNFKVQGDKHSGYKSLPVTRTSKCTYGSQPGSSLKGWFFTAWF